MRFKSSENEAEIYLLMHQNHPVILILSNHPAIGHARCILQKKTFYCSFLCVPKNTKKYMMFAYLAIKVMKYFPFSVFIINYNSICHHGKTCFSLFVCYNKTICQNACSFRHCGINKLLLNFVKFLNNNQIIILDRNLNILFFH